MKAYILTESDLEALATAIDRDPQHGFSGGSSRVLSDIEQQAFKEAHRFYNYQIRCWIEKVKQ
jgi:hypothetical protein